MIKLRSICDFQSGGTPSKGKIEYFNGDIPWITTTSLNGSRIDEKDAVNWITEKAIKETAARIVPANSIMVGTRVGVGKVAINTIDMSTSQDVISLLNIDEKKWSKDYLCKFIQGKSAYLNSQARGATIKGIKIDVLANLEVPTIDYKQQQFISETIDAVRSVISARRRELHILDELIRARFVEMFEDEKNLMAMSDICSIITDGTHQPPKFKKDGIPFIFVSNITGDKLTYDAEKFIDQDTYDELVKRTPIEIGDVLLSTVGSYGHPAVVKSEKKFLFQRHIAYLKPRREFVDSDYLHGAILSPEAQRQIEEGVKGIAQKTLNLSEIKKMRIPVPNMVKQKEFAAFVSHVDKSKAVIQKSLDEMQLLFDSLMQQYFG
jgi:type I restriction enzyme S subunit